MSGINGNKRHASDDTNITDAGTDNKRQRIDGDASSIAASMAATGTTTASATNVNKVDMIINAIQQLAHAGHYSMACHLLDEHLSIILDHFQALHTSRLDEMQSNSMFDSERSALAIAHDSNICQVLRVVARHTKDKIITVSMRFIRCMFDLYTMECFLVDAILSNNEFMTHYWYSLLQHCKKNGMSVGSALSRPCYTVIPGLKTLNSASYVVADMYSDISESESKFQFEWLFRICGLHLADLGYFLPYMIQVRLNDLLCNCMGLPIAGTHTTVTKIRGYTSIYDLHDSLLSSIQPLTTVPTTITTMRTATTSSKSSLLVDDITSVSDKDIIASLGLGASVSLLKRCDNLSILEPLAEREILSPIEWIYQYLRSANHIPLDQDSRLLDHIVYLSSQERYRKGLYALPGLHSSSLRDHPNGIFNKCQHGAIVRWLWNGIYRSKWPVDTAENIKELFKRVQQPDQISTCKSEVKIEVLAAVYVFKTPQSLQLYDAVHQDNALPHVLVILVFEYLSIQPGAGGPHDIMNSLLIDDNSKSSETSITIITTTPSLKNV